MQTPVGTDVARISCNCGWCLQALLIPDSLNQKAIDVFGKPKLRTLESVKEDLKKMGVRKSKSNLRGRKRWRTILDEAKVYQGL